MRGASQIDLDATAKRGFLEPESAVLQDGREILVKKDWQHRKAEVFNAYCGVCVYCGYYPSFDAHHDPIPRRLKRDDRMLNLKLACRRCHNAQHPEKQPQWSVRA